MRNVAVALSLVVFAGQAFAGTIVPTSQTREVSGWASASDSIDSGTDADSAVAPDFATFQEARSAQVVLDGAIGTGGGEQTSEIGPNGIVATGSAFATAESFEDFASAEGVGESRLEVSFMVPVPSFYRITGFIEAFDSGITEIRLSGPLGLVFDDFAFGPAQTVDLDETGLLMPGLHTWLIDADGSAFADSFSMEFAYAAYDVELGVATQGSGGEARGLRVDRLAAGDVRLDWDASCRPDDTDYEVYQGEIGAFADAELETCSTGGQLQRDVAPAFDAAFFLVVPTDGSTEGSYGRESDDDERPQAPDPCRAQQLGAPVCF